MERDIHIGIYLAVMAFYIGAILGVLYGVMFLLLSNPQSNIIIFNPRIGDFEIKVSQALFITAGIMSIVFGIANFFIAKGLWKGWNKARIFAIVFASLDFLIGIFYLQENLGFIAIMIMDLAIIYYLGFRKEAKMHFNRPKGLYIK